MKRTVLRDIISKYTLSDLYSPDDHVKITEVKVKLLSSEVLAIRAFRYSHNGSAITAYGWGRWHLILEGGEIIKNAVMEDYRFTSNYAHTPSSSLEGEDLEDALDRLGLPFSVIKMALYDERHYDDVNDVDGRYVDIYVEKFT